MKSMLQFLERRLERYAIPHLSLALALGQVAVWAMLITKPELAEKLALIPVQVMQGEFYRLASFLILPCGTNILTLFGIYFFYIAGETLEVEWGTFRYNLYLLIGYLATVAVSWANPAFPTYSSYIGGSVFLAFAWLYPEFVLRIYFIFPIKIKYLALITWIAYLYTVTFGDWAAKFAVLASVANFLLFFGKRIVWRILNGKKMMEASMKMIRQKRQGIHRCTTCGITERDDINLEFRYCSKCEGSFEYCEIHLKTHEHRTAPKPVQ